MIEQSTCTLHKWMINDNKCLLTSENSDFILVTNLRDCFIVGGETFLENFLIWRRQAHDLRGWNCFIVGRENFLIWRGQVHFWINVVRRTDEEPAKKVLLIEKRSNCRDTFWVEILPVSRAVTPGRAGWRHHRRWRKWVLTATVGLARSCEGREATSDRREVPSQRCCSIPCQWSNRSNSQCQWRLKWSNPALLKYRNYKDVITLHLPW